jgi:hypothetical protein
MGKTIEKTSEASRLSLEKNLQRKGGFQPPKPPIRMSDFDQNVSIWGFI